MKTRIIYGLLAGLFFSLYWLTWSGAVLFAGILAAFLFTYLVITWFHRHSAGFLGIASVVVAGVVTALIFTSRIIPRAFSGPTAMGTMELEPLNLVVAWQNFGVITFLVPIILVLLAYQAVKRGDASLTLLLVWSAVILAIMLEHQRFAYYFAVNASLLAGWFIWYTWQKLSKQDLPRAIAVMAILCGLVLFPNIQQATAKYAYHTPSDAWCETLAWVKENTREDSLILAWFDYGYWIQRMGGREAYITGSMPVKKVEETARFFLSPEWDSPMHFDYLILDYPTTTYKLEGVTIWAGEPVGVCSPEYCQSLVVRLYQGEPVNQYVLVYQSEQEIEGIAEVKVFYRRKIIDGQ